jgi:NADH:ubiquinone oxidoreductase subunit H
LFAFIFIAEYINIIFIILFTSILFRRGWEWIVTKQLILIIITVFYCSLVLFIRRTYPRFRYDILMSLTWKRFLPISILILLRNCFIQ